MPVAAVPNYLGSDFSQASPGMRFGMYLKLWENQAWSKSKDRPLNSAKCLNDNDQKTMQALLARQRQAFDTVAATDGTLCLEALATAPFTTGLGNEHPLENGFAFLNPYGLPYLPGSGVKGVLRQAARELASGGWNDAHGWDDAAITALFGRESAIGDTEHRRGALVFWDVIPQIADASLAVEIMTPHQGHYYQEKQDPKAGNSITPHDSGQPNPISFLTVPPKSGFVFHVQCDLAHLKRITPDLASNGFWKTLLEAAFTHTFKWLGFGAKTAVGYGAMGEDAAAKERKEQRERDTADQLRRKQEALARQEALTKMSPAERAMCEFLDARKDKNQPELSALLGGLKLGTWNGELKIEIALHVKTLMCDAKKWKEKSEKKKPEKDNDYQDTLRLMAWLQGK